LINLDIWIGMIGANIDNKY